MKPQYIIAAVFIIILVVYFGTCNNGSGVDVNENTSLVDSANANDLAVDTLNLQNLSESEQLQLEMNKMIENEIQESKSSGNVKAMLASFELGMSKRQVRKHMLKMKQKKHLVRVQKSANLFEYVYQLKLESGKSNTYMDFEYSREGGVYKSICKPSKFRKMSKSDFLNEVKDLFTDWYGEPDFEVPSTKGCPRYIWITGNQHLDLYCTTKKVEFIYTDLNYEIPPNIEGGGDERPDVKVML